MFSKIVPAFTTDNIAALGSYFLHPLSLSVLTEKCAGPLVLVAIIYQAMGIVIGWLVRQLFWVPHRFRYGILVAGGFYNAGDIREQQNIYAKYTRAPSVPRSDSCLCALCGSIVP